MPVKLIADNKPLSYQDFDKNFIELYPIGSVFMTTRQKTVTEVKNTLGFGTWEKYGQGRQIMGVDTSTDDGSLDTSHGPYVTPNRKPAEQVFPMGNLSSTDAPRNRQQAVRFEWQSSNIAKIRLTHIKTLPDNPNNFNSERQNEEERRLATGDIITISDALVNGSDVGINGKYKMLPLAGQMNANNKKDGTTGESFEEGGRLFQPLDGQTGTAGGVFDNWSSSDPNKAPDARWSFLTTAGEENGTSGYALEPKELPTHHHEFNSTKVGSGAKNSTWDWSTGARGGGQSDNPTQTVPAAGDDGAHNNRQPSRQVYMYKRTA
jgi:hypothetical protein